MPGKILPKKGKYCVCFSRGSHDLGSNNWKYFFRGALLPLL